MMNFFKHRGAFAALLLLVVLAYLPVWKAGFIWDDDAHLTTNPCIVGPKHLIDIWTSHEARICPLTLTTFWVEHQLWGLRPLPYHLVNVLLHAANALLLWRLLRVLGVRFAWLGAALWALHPVQVETVAWITELKNTQSGLFFLLTLLCFVRWLDSGRGYALVLLCAALAMASKSSTVVLPIVLALLWWWRRGEWRWRNVLRLLPMLAFSVITAALSIWTQRLEGGMSDEWHRSLVERFITAGAVGWTYLSKLLWPHPLIFIYPRWHIDAQLWWWYLPSLLALAALVALLRWRAGMMTFACFVVLLLPVLGLVDHYFFRYSFVGDHFQYLASMAPLALLGAWLGRQRIASAAVLLLIGTLSFQHARIFESDPKLWSDTLAKNPECWMAYNNIGSTQISEGRVDEGLASFEKSLALNEHNYEAHNNIGMVQFQRGQFDECITHQRRALELYPNCTAARLTLGAALMERGKLDDAINAWSLVPIDDARRSTALCNIGIAHQQAGHIEAAIQAYQAALEIDGGFALAHFNFAQLLLGQRRIPEAIEHFQLTARLQPDNFITRQNLAWLLAASPDANVRNGPLAIIAAKEACALTKNSNPILMRTLAVAFAANLQFDLARQTAEQALQLADAAANQNLVSALKQDLDSYARGLRVEDASLR